MSAAPTPDKPLRLCMIGAGGHASRNIYPCFPMLRNAQVVANADLDAAKAKACARMCGIPRSYTDWQEMVAEEKPDGVMICVGPSFHAETAIALLGRGFHVYTEKPPAADLAQCRRLLAAYRASGRICMTGLKKRFAPAYVKAKALIDDRARFGDPALFSVMRTAGEWKRTPADAFILDSSIHVVDLASFLCGPVASVHGQAGPGSTFAFNLTFANGAVGTLAVTDRMSYRRGWEDVTVITTGGLCVQVDNSVDMLAFHLDQPVGAHRPEFVAGNSHSSTEQGFLGELQAFADAIARNDIEPEGSISRTGHCLAVIEAMRRSLAERKPLPVEALS